MVVSGKKSVCAAISNNPHIQWCLDALGMPANAVSKRGASPMIKAALVNGRECWVYAPTNQLEMMVRTVVLSATSTARQYLCESCGWTRAGTSTLLIDHFALGVTRQSIRPVVKEPCRRDFTPGEKIFITELCQTRFDKSKGGEGAAAKDPQSTAHLAPGQMNIAVMMSSKSQNDDAADLAVLQFQIANNLSARAMDSDAFRAMARDGGDMDMDIESGSDMDIECGDLGDGVADSDGEQADKAWGGG